MGFLKDDPTQRGLNPDGTETLRPDVHVPDVPAAYQGLLDSNPYMNLNYRQSNFQRFLSAMGFRTGYDVFKENNQLQAQEWNANVAAMAFENQYNSPDAQAQRMRAAGQNPDLLGTGDVAGSASMPEDMNPPAPTESDSQAFGQFANMLMTGISTAVGVAQSLGNLAVLETDVAAGQIGNSQSIMSLAIDAILGATPENPFLNDRDGNPTYIYSNYGPAQDKLRKDAYDSFGQFLSPRRRKAFKSAIDQFVGSLPASAEQYKEWYSRIKDRKSLFTEAFSSTYDGGFGEQDDVLSIICKHLGVLDNEIISNKKGAENAAAQAAEQTSINEKMFGEAVDPTLAGQTLNSQNESAKKGFDIKAAMDSAFSDIMKDLEKLAFSQQKGHRFAYAALLVFRLMSMMNFTSSGGIGKDGPFSSSGVGFHFQ